MPSIYWYSVYLRERVKYRSTVGESTPASYWTTVISIRIILWYTSFCTSNRKYEVMSLGRCWFLASDTVDALYISCQWLSLSYSTCIFNISLVGSCTWLCLLLGCPVSGGVGVYAGAPSVVLCLSWGWGLSNLSASLVTWQVKSLCITSMFLPSICLVFHPWQRRLYRAKPVHQERESFAFWWVIIWVSFEFNFKICKFHVNCRCQTHIGSVTAYSLLKTHSHF